MSNDIPTPLGAVSPYLTVKNGRDAVAFYEKILGAECTYLLPNEGDDRLMHATLKFGDLLFQLSDEFPEHGGFREPDRERGSPVAISLRYQKPDDVDTVYASALKNGATKSFEPADMFWGDRFCQFIDPFGHRWMLGANLEQET